MDKNLDEAKELLIQGKIGVLPTDTLYGIHAKALNRKSVERIYNVRERNPQKPFIILISSLEDLNLFGITITDTMKDFLENHWPDRLSVILPCNDINLEYLHRGTNSLAFRMPKKIDLLELVNQTGPLVSTSVNPEGKEPAKTIEEAKLYFGDKLDFYVDQGILNSPPSTVIKIENEKVEIIRQGAVRIKNG
jgi:L-threonylcarbamoyladenylate synthase